MNMGYYETFINLRDLTSILNDKFKCELCFRLLEDNIELGIRSLETCNTYYIIVDYEFKVDNVIEKFKENIIREALKLWKDIS